MSFTPAIRNWQSQPPAGGWPFTYVAENGQKHYIDGMSPGRCIDKLRDILKLNGWFVSDAHTWAIANGFWTKRDPARALGNVVTLEQLPKKEEMIPVRDTPHHKPHWDTKPEYYGAKLWGALHLFGACFDKHAWDSMIRLARKMLSPTQSPSTGCAKCSHEFYMLCLKHPPENVTNEQEAAEWTFMAHNAVNQKLGKLPMTWRAAARLHAWHVSL